jgi:hypothetical protein
MILLAQAAADSSGVPISAILGWVTSFVVAVLGLVLRHQAKKQGLEEGRAQSVTIENRPLLVAMEKEFVRREDFNEWRHECRDGTKAMALLFKEVSDQVGKKHLELLATLEIAAKTGRDGRVALWNEVRPLSNDLAALKATVAAHLQHHPEPPKRPRNGH